MINLILALTTVMTITTTHDVTISYSDGHQIHTVYNYNYSEVLYSETINN